MSVELHSQEWSFSIIKNERKSDMSKTKAVLFDLDGTLIDTEKYYQQIWPKSVEHFGVTMTREQALSLRSLGRPFAPQRFAEWYGEDFDYQASREYRTKLFNELVATQGINLKPGVEETLSWLKEKGILIATATATDEERTTRFLKSAGVFDYFDRICCASHVKEGKPAPYLYLYAVEQVGVPKENCIAVEDAPNGVRSAHAAGITTCYIPDTVDDEPEIRGLFDHKLKILTDLKEYIEL